MNQMQKEVQKMQTKAAEAMQRAAEPSLSKALMPTYDVSTTLDERHNKYRSVLTRRVDRARSILRETMGDGEADFSYNDYHRKPFSVQESTGEGIGQLTLVMNYDFKKASFGDKFFREDDFSKVTLEASLRGQGKDINLGAVTIGVPAKWSVEAHNVLEEHIAEYVYNAVTRVSAEVAKLKKSKVQGAHLDGHFEAHLACDLAQKLQNPSFLGAYEQFLGKQNMHTICQKLEAEGQTLTDTYKRVLEKIAAESKKTHDGLAEKLRGADAEIKQHVETRTQAVNAEATRALEGLQKYEAEKRSELEKSLLAEVQEKKTQMYRDAERLEKDYQQRKEQIERDLESVRLGRKDTVDYQGLFTDMRISDIFSKSQYCTVGDDTRHQLSKQVLDFARSGRSKLTGESILRLIETVRGRVEGHYNHYSHIIRNQEAEGIVGISLWVAERADADRLIRVMNGVTDLNGGRKVTMEQMEKTLKNLIA